ncbi:hypothetical protein NE237_025331 [Protea cynaroides]|uniref:Uncharacterized protein n=1 Tax=Protea cynaroides TaxID=273540 RepID=A0A9Q0K193_9MAGN|nr:hypothetical protein NE237_025331 [Protea cynaroides]
MRSEDIQWGGQGDFREQIGSGFTGSTPENEKGGLSHSFTRIGVDVEGQSWGLDWGLHKKMKGIVGSRSGDPTGACVLSLFQNTLKSSRDLNLDQQNLLCNRAHRKLHGPAGSPMALFSPPPIHVSWHKHVRSSMNSTSECKSGCSRLIQDRFDGVSYPSVDLLDG